MAADLARAEQQHEALDTILASWLVATKKTPADGTIADLAQEGETLNEHCPDIVVLLRELITDYLAVQGHRSEDCIWDLVQWSSRRKFWL